MIEHLNNPNPRQRTAAIQALSRAPDVPALLDALNHPSALMRVGAARVLGLAKIEVAVSALIERLRDDDATVRMASIDALRLIRNPHAREPLVACLRDSHQGVVMRAAYALAKLADLQTVNALIDTLQHPDWGVQTMVAYALARIGDSHAIVPLIDAMRVYAGSVQNVMHRWDIAENQMMLTEEKIQHGFAYTNVLEQFAAAIGQFGVVALDPIKASLTDPNPYMRQYLAVALGHIHDARRMPALEQLMNDSDAEVRRMAAWAVSQSML